MLKSERISRKQGKRKTTEKLNFDINVTKTINRKVTSINLIFFFEISSSIPFNSFNF